MPNDPLTTLRRAFDQYDRACGLPADGRRRAAFEKFLAETYRLNCQPASEVERMKGQLERWHFSGAEVDGLRRMLQPGERLISVLPRSIQSDRRTIPRDSLRPARLPWQTVSTYEREIALSYPTEDTISDLERQYAEEQRTAEMQAKQNERAANDAWHAQAQLEAARQRQIEAYEDNLAAIIRRSDARREAQNGQ